MGRGEFGGGSRGPAPIEYHGFSGTWEPRTRTFIFASCEERDRWQIRTYGEIRNAYREQDDAVDERPLLVHRYPPFEDETERMVYMAAIEANPRELGEGPMTYVRRISQLVTERYQRIGRPMPKRNLTRRDRDQRLMALREQAGKLDSGKTGGEA